MAESLVLFTIGPVQRFIETARKTEDLWMGSYILSYLNGVAMDMLTDHFRNQQIEIIFPSLDNQPLIKFFKPETLDDAERERLKLPTLPNRLLALDKNGTVTQDDMKKVERNVRDEFERIAEYVFDQAFEKRWRGSHAQDIFNRQIPHFLEIYWVLHPMNGADYKEEYNLLERKLGGVKSCRRFEQIEEKSRKCSLCGEREVIHFNRFETETMGEMNKTINQDWSDHWTKAAEANIPYHKYLNPNEFLCAICLTKRLGGTYFEECLQLDLKGTFPSTAEVATAAFKLATTEDEKTTESGNLYKQFLEGVRQLDYLPNIENIVKTIPLPLVRKHLHGFDIDGSWLYEEMLKTESFIKYYTEYDEKNVTEAKKNQVQRTLKPLVDSQQELKRVHKKQCEKLPETLFGTHPAKYYALIVMDGDSMGKKLNHVQDSREHEQISQLLNAYSLQAVPEIVEHRNLGKLLYAGGDDLVALVNLKDLFAVLRQLHQAFPSDKLQAIEGLKNLNGNHSFGVSAGVCIAHYKTPLGTVRRYAKNMEQDAKKLDGKNAVSIALLKHSGNISTTCFKWEYGQFDVLECAQETSYALRVWLSNKFLYSFREEFSRLCEENGRIPIQLRQLMTTELTRLLQRRKRKDGMPGDRITRLSEQLAELQGHVQNFNDVIGFLEVCNFIAREG